jgi:hypothetical protein
MPTGEFNKYSFLGLYNWILHLLIVLLIKDTLEPVFSFEHL